MSNLKKLMKSELPSINLQKKLVYRPSLSDIEQTYDLINLEIFNNKLIKPEFKIHKRTVNYWAMCKAKCSSPIYTEDSNVTIVLSNKWYCIQWFIMVLAHEMCHQYQWDIFSSKRVKIGKDPIMNHGKSFFKFKKKLLRHGIPLKIKISSSTWFAKQNLLKC